MKKIISMILCGVLAASLISGCSSSQGTSSAAPKKENVFTFARQNDLQTWDIYKAGDSVAAMLNGLVHDTLVKGNRKDEFYPSLATEWSFSEDGKKCTFKLRKDVKFHNGDPLTSEDVKFSIERWIKDKTIRPQADWSALESVDAPDSYTAVFNFKRPWSTFLATIMDTYIIDKKLYEAQGDKMWVNPNGSGPWKFVSWTGGQQTVLARNDDWWGWGDKKSNVDKIVYKVLAEPTTRLAAIQTGEIDLAEAMSKDQEKQLQGAKGLKFETGLTSGVTQLNFKCKDSIFADVNVRKAISLAIDRKLIVDSIIGGGKPTVWLVDSSCLGYKQVEPKYDPEEAKKLLSQSSYKGEPFKIYAINGQVARSNEVLQAMVSMLNKVGFNASFEFMESAAMAERRVAGKYDIYFAGGSVTAGDPTGMISQRWMNDLYKSGYVNEKMWSLVKAANVELDAKKRSEILQQVLQISYEDSAPMVPIYQVDSDIIYKDSLSGMKFYPDRMNDYSRIMKN